MTAKALTNSDFTQLALFGRILGDETRLRILMELREHKPAKGDLDLLQLLMQHPEQVVRVEQIYSGLSGDNDDYLPCIVTHSVRRRINSPGYMQKGFM